MLEHLSYLYGFNLDRSRTLVKDLNDNQMVQQPNGLVNHPAWSIGHLSLSAEELGQLLGLESNLPAGWSKKFNGSEIPIVNVSHYPSKLELLAELSTQHARNTEALKESHTSLFSQEHPNENVRKKFPTKGDMILFLMTSHEMLHLGQLAAWRRAMGLKPNNGI